MYDPEVGELVHALILSLRVPSQNIHEHLGLDLGVIMSWLDVRDHLELRANLSFLDPDEQERGYIQHSVCQCGLSAVSLILKDLQEDSF